jgi:hypothetical protein
MARHKPENSIKLRVVPTELKIANQVVSQWHRHHKPAQGHRFSLAVIDEQNVIRGCAIVGRPVARLAGAPDRVLEVIRVATDGTPNTCSALLAAAARAGKAMGYERIQTYTLPEEGGFSLRGAGWVCVGEAGGGQWKHTDGKPRRTDQPTSIKHRWELTLNPKVGPSVIPVDIKNSCDDYTLDLFNFEEESQTT